MKALGGTDTETGLGAEDGDSTGRAAEGPLKPSTFPLAEGADTSDAGHSNECPLVSTVLSCPSGLYIKSSPHQLLRKAEPPRIFQRFTNHCIRGLS